MKRKFSLFLSAITFISATGSGSAQDGDFIEGAIAGGSGCTLAGDPLVTGNTVTFILTDYNAIREKRGRKRITCNLAVKVNLSPGVTIRLDNVDYRGGVFGLNDGETQFFREYFFAGQFSGDRRFTVTKFNEDGDPEIIQDDSDDYLEELGQFTARDEVTNIGVAPCGGEAIWRANTAIAATAKSTEDSQAQIAIDTVDVSADHKIVFSLSDFIECPAGEEEE